jgi:hypothetical protein
LAKGMGQKLRGALLPKNWTKIFVKALPFVQELDNDCILHTWQGTMCCYLIVYLQYFIIVLDYALILACLLLCYKQNYQIAGNICSE